MHALFGDEFIYFNLVFCSSNGKPIEENGLPKVVFHSLRHSSITYKLKLNGGDMKSVQGDSGHAQVKMVADVYSHIIDDDRLKIGSCVLLRQAGNTGADSSCRNGKLS